ncbi:hypothetical protein LAG90_17035 [Marinilongibacter aquaticus]|uniref:hypothetical protein n=1 Tax=Marinilongibacter aquaticus TaxID=2975157 RepID=UPI0021BDE829|nr:hypothetical protein [Marinilongibacter aquaticus]UBM58509.1 hypothetical protein LAG90_17035 [Marinilongibacter aquaticus]
MSEEVKGDKGEMKHNCENHDRCMQMIQAVLDGSATQEELEHFKTEIKHCLPCIEGYELEKSIKEAVNSKIDKKCCPDATIKRIKASVGLAGIVALALLLNSSWFERLF